MRSWFRDDRGRLAVTDILVFGAVLASALGLFVWAYQTTDLLWRDPLHDRNSHYLLGLELALSLRELDPIAWFDRILGSLVWPPVHGLILSFVLLIGGIDHRLGMVPSVLGWAATLWFSWLIVRDSFPYRLTGTAAGLIALALIATSPAFALISTDVMLEGLGSGLSSLCLWAFMRAWREPGNDGHWRVLAVSLTVLFFEKYNYWGFAVLAIALTAFLIDPVVRATVRDALVLGIRNAGRLVLRPLFLAGAAFAMVALAVGLRGPTVISPFGLRVSLYPPGNLITVAYAFMFVAAAQTWRDNAQALRAFLGRPATILLAWMVLPIAISFLLPKRLSTFLWFVGPLNGTSAMQSDPLGGLAFYAKVFVAGFVTLPPIGWLVIVLFAVSAVLAARLRPESRVVLVFAGVALLAMIMHPQQQARFLSTVAFALFCGASFGAVLLLRLIASARATTVLGGAAAALVLGLAWLMPAPDAAYPVAIRARDGASQAILVDRVRPAFTPGRPLAVAALFGRSGLSRWPMEEACRCLVEFDEFWMNPADRAGIAAQASAWLAGTRADQAIIIDLPATYGLHRTEDLKGILDAVAAQSEFRLTGETGLPADGGRVLALQRR